TSAINIGDTVNGAIDMPGQSKTYTFRLGEATPIEVYSLFNSSGFNWTLSGPSGTVVSGRDFQSTDSFDGYSVFDLVAGSYTFTRSEERRVGEEFSFRVLEFASDKNITLDAQQTQALTPGNG